MSLLERQRQFLGEVSSEDDAAPSQPGIAIYRNAYRARLIEALRNTYERVHAWLGDATFDAAAAHHSICHPPHSWTLDDAGEGFAETLAALFPRDLEVEELAWLDAQLATALTATDEAALTPARFAAQAASYDDAQWAGLRLRFASSLTLRAVRSNVAPLWNALSDTADVPPARLLDETATLAVWREGLVPRFRVLDTDEAGVLASARVGVTFGDLCRPLAELYGEAIGIERAGTILGRWVADGLLVAGDAPLDDSAAVSFGIVGLVSAQRSGNEQGVHHPAAP